jgi:hypothetical protein
MRERQDFVQRQPRFRLPYKNIERILFEVLASFFAALQITGARDLNLNVLLNSGFEGFSFFRLRFFAARRKKERRNRFEKRYSKIRTAQEGLETVRHAIRSSASINGVVSAW